MKAHPIILSAEMVRAILEGRKTQTRRIVKPQPPLDALIKEHSGVAGYWIPYTADGRLMNSAQGSRKNDCGWYCPYGQVGDHLWVRETFVLESDAEYGYSEDELKRIGVDRPIKSEISDGDYYHLIPHYRATEPEPNIVPPWVDDFDDKTRWSPAIFMPRWASRITLEITGLRVERLQEITDVDIRAEGMGFAGIVPAQTAMLATGTNNLKDLQVALNKAEFMDLWDSLNAKRGYGWDTNPFVWVIEFGAMGVRVK